MNYENENKTSKRLDEIMENGPEGEESPPRKSQADKLVELVEESGAILFKDQMGAPYAHVPVKNHKETFKIKSRNFNQWLGRAFWEKERKSPGSNALQSALNILEGKAIHEGEQNNLENRLAYFEDAIWYDMTDPEWKAICISKNGWTIENCPPVLFRRYSHQKAQLMPAQVGNLNDFFTFTNIPNPKQRLLLLVYIVSCFIPDIPHPVAIFHGPQGASKTTLARMIRSLVDPSIIGVLSLSNPSELPQHLFHHWFAFFDNITRFSGETSDLLCRAVTGEGFSKRELFSDDDDIIFTFRRCIGLNGINIIAYKPDLLDRSLLFQLDRIPKNERRTESELWEAFDKAKPQFLGAIFSALSKVLAIKDTVVLEEKPRMADFAVWGCAIARALGYKQEEFLEAYSANIDDQHNEAIQESPIALALLHFMKDKTDGWRGNATELFEQLNTAATHLHLSTQERYWPKAPNALSRRLNEAKTNLEEVGISIQISKISDGNRMITINKYPKNIAKTADTAESSQAKQTTIGSE